MSRRDAVWLAEPIPERRFGLKGAGAAAALADAGITVPTAHNCWAPLDGGDAGGSWNVIARLGSAEFFIEEAGAAPRVAALEALAARGVRGVVPVLREDAALVLGGAAAPAALAEVCNVDLAAAFGARAGGGRPIYMTSMIGVGVLVLPQIDADDGPIYRIWCDPSYGEYLWDALERIVKTTTEKPDEPQ